MLIRYVGRHGDQYVKDQGQWRYFERDGDPVELSDELGTELVTTRPTHWVEHTPATPAKKPAAKTTSTPEEG